MSLDGMVAFSPSGQTTYVGIRNLGPNLRHVVLHPGCMFWILNEVGSDLHSGGATTNSESRFDIKHAYCGNGRDHLRVSDDMGWRPVQELKHSGYAGGCDVLTCIKLIPIIEFICTDSDADVIRSKVLITISEIVEKAPSTDVVAFGYDSDIIIIPAAEGVKRDQKCGWIQIGLFCC